MPNNEKTGAEVKYKELTHEFSDIWADEGEQEVSVICRFRRPNREQLARFQKQAMKDGTRAFTTLLKDVAHPDDKANLQTALEKWPGIATTFGGAVVQGVGVGELGK